MKISNGNGVSVSVATRAAAIGRAKADALQGETPRRDQDSQVEAKNVGHLAYKTFRLLDTSPTSWTLRLLDISPTGQFAYETFRLLDTSPTPWTVRQLNVNTRE